MTKPIRLDAAANKEIDAAVAWYEERLAGLGLELLAEIEEAKRRLAGAPGTCARVPAVALELNIRRSQVHRFPYSLVFVELPGQLRVLALAHVRRRPNYWRKRLRTRKRRPRTGR